MLTSLINTLQTVLLPLLANIPSDIYYVDDNTPTLILLIIGTVLMVVLAVLYVVSAFFFMRLFAKANVPAWKAWVPFVNLWKFFELGGYHGALSLLIVANIVPCIGQVASIVGIVFMCMAAYQIGLKLGKDSVWVVLFIFLGIVWLGIVAFDRSVWNDSLAKPALGLERPPSWPYYGSVI